MAQNYVLLERIELNASAASVTFSNIPQSGYTDLKIVVSARCDAAYERRVLQLQFNGATTNYSDRYLQGYNSAAGSGTNTGATYIELRDIDGATATSNTFSNMEIYVPNYTSSNYKLVSTDGVTETNGALAMNAFTASLWSSTAAITSITLTPGNGSFVQYSTLSLYGLAAVGTTPAIGAKASGGNITTDGTYWIHSFLSTGAFTPFTNLTCDALVVAGGAGGGCDIGGGGGAGGLRSTVGATGGGGSLESAISVTAQAYTIQVGAGGAGGVSGSTNRGVSGTDSIFSSITSTGGGGGGTSVTPYNGVSGGSGGGAGGTNGGGGGTSGGTGTTNQGYGGGVGYNLSANSSGGGGGGAGAVGATPNGSIKGSGGTGVATAISGTSTTYAGGGGGGTFSYSPGSGLGGTGGGGAGGAYSPTTVGTAGTTNLGAGGGGGSAGGAAGGAGGSGIVIIRYTIA